MACVSVGCGTEVLDTEGRRFSVDCETAPCALRQAGAAPRPEPDAAAWSPLAQGRLLLACPPGGNEGVGRYRCRPLVCESGTTCARLGGPDFVCRAGLCQAAERAITQQDRLSLCLAGTAEWKESREQRARVALAQGCRPPCEVPAKCRTP